MSLNLRVRYQHALIFNHMDASCMTLQLPRSAFFGDTNAFPSIRLRGWNTDHMGSCGKKILARCTLVLDKCYGAIAVQGTGRQLMEDTYSIDIDPKGLGPSFFGVFDGHGGTAVAEMLKSNLWPIYKKKLSGDSQDRKSIVGYVFSLGFVPISWASKKLHARSLSSTEAEYRVLLEATNEEPDLIKATISTYLEVDQLALAQPKGLLGALRERGLGGSRCGATAATVVLLPSLGGQQRLVAANVGDARIILARGGQAVQLTIDHKPDVEAERKRIEAKNRFPKKPLVVNVEGTWRVGGLLALSRAFGNAYMKNWSDGRIDGAQGGYGLIAEPDVSIQSISSEDELIILGTDGLWEKIENQEVVDICLSTGLNKPLEDISKHLVKIAQDRGTTDDISVIVLRLPKVANLEPIEGQ